MYKLIYKYPHLSLQVAVMVLAMLVFAGCDQSASGPANKTGSGNANAGSAATVKEKQSVSVIYNFDDGTNQGWTFSDQEFGLQNDQFCSGNNSIGATTPNSSKETVAFIEPAELSGGNRITSFSFYYRETTNNTGAGIRLLDSNGNMVVAAATGNPNYNTFGADGYASYGQPTSSDYDVWVQVQMVFDWQAGTADIIFTDTESDASETHSVDLAKSTGVSRIEIADYHNPEAGGFYAGNSGAFYFWADDISFTTSGGDSDGSSGDLVTAVSAGSGSDYQITSLSAGSEQYVDRDYTFTSVPSSYEGADYIQTANDDKTASDDPLLTFDLTREATVAVFYDNRLSRPSWLSASYGWSENGLDVQAEGYPEGARMYEKTFSAGMIELSGNDSNSQNSSMYGVAVTDSPGDDGDDNGGGQSVIITASKWTQGQINEAQPGDTLLFEPGEHGPIDIDDFTSTASRPLVLKSMDPDNPATIRRDDNSGGQGIGIRRSSYVVVDNLIIDGAQKGIWIEGSDHVILRNNIAHRQGAESIAVHGNSKHVDVINNKIYDTGLTQPQYGEGIYIGTGGYTHNPFPDNTEYIWIEGNECYNNGKAEGINIKSEVFYCTVRDNYIHDEVTGTPDQYNVAGITVESSTNVDVIPSMDEYNYRADELREIWVENNRVENIAAGVEGRSNGHGIMVGGTGVYLINNYISNTEQEAILLNAYQDIGLPIYLYGNTFGTTPGGKTKEGNGLDIRETDPGDNPNQPQSWY